MSLTQSGIQRHSISTCSCADGMHLLEGAESTEQKKRFARAASVLGFAIPSTEVAGVYVEEEWLDPLFPRGALGHGEADVFGRR